MLELWVMRHGEAVDPDVSHSDFERSLTARGQQQVRDLAAWLRPRVAGPEQIWHSPLRRARETALAMSEAWLPDVSVLESPLLSPGMSAERLLQNMSRQTSSRILCVGHQPDIGRCLHDLVGGGRFDIPPGTCAAVYFSGALLPGAGALLWMATPDWFS